MNKITSFVLSLALFAPYISAFDISPQQPEAFLSGAFTAVAAYVAGKGGGYFHDASTTAGNYIIRDHAECLSFLAVSAISVPLCYILLKRAHSSPKTWRRAYLGGILSGLTFGIGAELCTRPWDASLFPTFNALLSWFCSADKIP